MRPATARAIGLTLAIVSAGALGASVVQLARSLSHRNVQIVRFVGAIPGERFTFQGHTGEVERLEPEREGGDPVLRLSWRGRHADFPVPFPEDPAEEGLERYSDWFAIVLLVDGEDSEEALREKWATDERGVPDVVPRLVAAARYPAQGYDRSSWGLVRRQEWMYRIAELHPDGPSDEAIEMHELSYEALDALHLPGKYTDEEFLLSPEERAEKLWMYYAMQQVTPPAQYRGRNKAQTDVVRSMGWAWPVAVVSTLGMVGGIALFASASVRRRF